MNKLYVIVLAILCLSACKDKTLSKEEVFQLLEKSGKYPKVYDHHIYTKDTEDGRKALDAGLERDSLLRVARHIKTGDNHAPVIIFTEKAKPYLLPADPGQLSSVQKVKTATEVLDQVTALKTNAEGTITAINYTTKFIEITPFAKLQKLDFNAPRTHQAKFVLTEGSWHME